MFRKNSECGRRSLTIAARLAFALGIAGAVCPIALAQESSATPATLHARVAPPGHVDLERAFWVCDFTATMRGIDATPVEACSAITAQFMNERFAGDFLVMLEWWRQNKPAAHARLAAAEGAAR